MNISREEKKIEALNRLRDLGIFPDAIKQFKNKDIVMVSEPPLGGLFWLSDEDKERVKEFENEMNALVYLVIRSFTEFGELDSYLYVSDHPDEWDMDNDDIQHGFAVAYVYNHDAPEFSELGSIGFEGRGGGLIRIY